MSKPLISVVLPIYNMEKYLGRCINSILNQSYKNIEIILVNDGSTDNTSSICKEYAQNNENIIAINQENGGPSKARNTGIDSANGEWIMFVDPDDYLSPNIIEELFSNLEKDTDIICCSCIVDIGNRKLESNFYNHNIVASNYKEKNEFFKQLLDYTYSQKKNIYTAIGVPWGKLYRKSFLLNYNIRFDKRLRRMQDNIFNMYAFYYAKEIKYINKSLYFYNFEHMSNSIKVYKYKDIEIEYNKALCRKETMKKLNMFEENKELIPFYINELAMFFTRIVKLSVLCNDLFINKNERKKIIEHYKNDTVFEELFKNINLINGKKNKLVVKLIKNRHYNVLFLLFKLNKVLKG